METTESPLEVLSRAATMVQDSSPPDYECVSKTLPGGRWRRDRRDKVSAKHRAAAQPTPDAPLDMTTPRGLPPPYSACSRARTSARPSVITCVAPRVAASRREQLSDPVIDEHFRRSLGNDYNNLFRDEANVRQENSVTVTGLSVDDHFAKALGDTWTKLQKSDATPAAAPSPPVAAAPPKDKLLPARRGLVTI